MVSQINAVVDKLEDNWLYESSKLSSDKVQTGNR